VRALDGVKPRHQSLRTPVSSQVSRRYGIRSLTCRHLSTRQKLACTLLLWWREVFVYFAFQVRALG